MGDRFRGNWKQELLPGVKLGTARLRVEARMEAYLPRVASSMRADWFRAVASRVSIEEIDAWRGDDFIAASQDGVWTPIKSFPRRVATEGLAKSTRVHR